MRNYKQYTRRNKESKAFTAVVVFVFLALVALFVLTACGMFDEPLWKPDVEIPMVNAQITWEQNNYGEAI